jgi:hypothetical protein
MTIQRARSTFVIACLATAVLVGCGGEEQETRTIVETVAPEQPSAPGPEQTPPTGQDPALEPLPPGVVGADGAYAMTVRDSSFKGFRITSDDMRPQESEWTFSTNCASECEIDMRRELQSGGFKSLTLTPAEGREGVFEADTSGETAGTERSALLDQAQRSPRCRRTPDRDAHRSLLHRRDRGLRRQRRQIERRRLMDRRARALVGSVSG